MPMMSVNATLRTAILYRRPVEMFAAGHLHKACPHALGYKDGRLQVLVFQFFGESASGGLWRCFLLDEIAWVKIIDGPWRTGPHPVLKIETSFEHIDQEVRPQAHASRRNATLALRPWTVLPERGGKEKPGQ